MGPFFWGQGGYIQSWKQCYDWSTSRSIRRNNHRGRHDVLRQLRGERPYAVQDAE